tara:strand:+ start:87 stop:884 length:798 start_codon:yes stop_codon:yes gene_type:complete
MSTYKDSKSNESIDRDRVFSFDIETRPCKPELVDKFTPPFEEFNEAELKYGNIKDPVKIQEKLNNAKIAHCKAEAAYLAKAQDKAALSPFTGSICAVGVYGKGGVLTKYDHDGKSEPEIIRWFWEVYERLCIRETRKGKKIYLAGWNSDTFDIPFLIKRSWYHGIRIPDNVIDVCLSSRHLWTTNLVDLMTVFNAGGDWQKRRFKLDLAGEYLAIGNKVNTKNQLFHELFYSEIEEDVSLAIRYYEQDLKLTFDIACHLLTEGMQ